MIAQQKLWNACTGDLIQDLDCKAAVVQVKFLKENILASRTWNSIIRFWNTNAGKWIPKKMKFCDLAFFAATLGRHRLAVGTGEIFEGLSLNSDGLESLMEQPNDLII